MRFYFYLCRGPRDFIFINMEVLKIDPEKERSLSSKNFENTVMHTTSWVQGLILQTIIIAFFD